MMLFRSLALGFLAALLLVEIGHLHSHLHAPTTSAQAPPTIIAVSAPAHYTGQVAAGNPAGVITASPSVVEQAPDPHTIVDITRARFDRYVNQTPFSSQARLVPTSRHGQTVGIKLYAVQPNSLFATLGLQNGDIIRTVNSLDVLGADYPAWTHAVQNPRSFVDLDVLRDGAPTRIVVLIHE